jgi:hypothetical protein
VPKRRHCVPRAVKLLSHLRNQKSSFATKNCLNFRDRKNIFMLSVNTYNYKDKEMIIHKNSTFVPYCEEKL